MRSDFSVSVLKARFLFVTVSLFALASTGLFPLVALELSEQGFNDQAVGLITSVFYLGGVIGAFTYGSFVGKFGLRVGIGVAAVLAALSTTGLLVFDNPLAWIILRFITGYALGSYYLTMDSWIGSIAFQSARGRLFAMYTTIRLVATSLGPIVIIFGSTQLSIIALSAIFILASVPPFFNEETDVSVGKTIDVASMYNVVKRFRWLLLIILCCGLQNSSFYALGAIYAKHVGMTSSGIAIFVSAVLFAPVLTGFPIGLLSDHFTRMGVASCISLIAAAAALTISIYPFTDVWIITSGAVIVGGGMVAMYGLALSRMVDVIGSDHSMKVATVGLLAYQLGSFFGPLLSGIMTHSLGSNNLYLAIAFFAFVAFIATRLDSHSQQ